MQLRKLYLELTAACNLDCAICYRRAWTESPLEMSAGTFARITEAVRRSPELRTVLLGGIGEPTSSPLILEALSSFPGKDIIVTTNGIALDDSVLRALAEHASLVVLSVDGLEDAFKRIRGAELAAVVASVRKLTAMRAETGKATPRIELQFVLSAMNSDDLPGVIDLAGDIGVDVVVVSHLLPQDAASAETVLYGRFEKPGTRDLYERARQRARRRGVSVLLPPLELKTERRCSFAEDGACYVDAIGDVVPCYRFSHDGTEFVFGREKKVFKHSFGNIADASLESIWESPAYAAYRRTLIENRYPSCPDCDLLEGCNMAADTTADCWSGSPSCADCLWARGFMRCP
ncbi:MAG TPA: tungsten cofactor oxidoreductase radical SAM maturase [Treponema sp.]|nr:MAG: hypothetical protein A2001_14810 [Treponema sp. GWC1_61_84]HCM25919.1 tungsten cofactor oxidoreductase radical SAM maturase [Treponema sp.]